jgi:Ca2+-binding EF-hand superfamily protein
MCRSKQALEESFRGQEWNQVFRDPVRRRDSVVLEGFWNDLKDRLVRRHGNLATAFHALDRSGDGQIDHQEFCDMLRFVHVPLDFRVTRAIFDQVSKGDGQLSLDELKQMLMDRTIKKVREVLHGSTRKQARIQKHVHVFMRRLAAADTASSHAAIDRFQQKLTSAFIREFWQSLLASLTRSKGFEQKVDRDGLRQAIKAMLGKSSKPGGGATLQEYETMFLTRIFDRATHGQSDTIPISTFISALVRCSPEPETKRKVRLLFEVFDIDCDGCLQPHQIKMMFTTLSLMNLALQEVRDEENFPFTYELAVQDGVRTSEKTCWQLRSEGRKVDAGTVVSFPELWAALQHLPEEELQGMLPGVPRIRWLGEEGDVTMPTTPRSPQSPHNRSRSQFGFGGELTMLPSSVEQNGWARKFPAGPREPSAELEAADAELFRHATIVRFRQALQGPAAKSMQASASDGFIEAKKDGLRRRSLRPEVGGALELEPPPGEEKLPGMSLMREPRGSPKGGQAAAASKDSHMWEAILAPMDGHTWGAKAADRFRLFAAAVERSSAAPRPTSPLAR